MTNWEQVADDLDAAADVIDARGWCQNTLKDAQGRMCAQGAVITATGTGLSEGWSSAAAVLRVDTAMIALTRYLAASGGVSEHLVSVTGWNDQGGRTKDDVTDAMRRAAKDLREKAQQ